MPNNAPCCRKAYECDALTVFTRPPLAVALPETEAQVQTVLKTCSGLGIPVTVRGAGTGLTGSGTATPDGLCWRWRGLTAF